MTSTAAPASDCSESSPAAFTATSNSRSASARGGARERGVAGVGGLDALGELGADGPRLRVRLVEEHGREFRPIGHPHDVIAADIDGQCQSAATLRKNPTYGLRLIRRFFRC